MEYMVKAKLDDLDEFTRAYLEAAEWSGLDEQDAEALELSVSPRWSLTSITRAKRECAEFHAANVSDLVKQPDAQAGHDFWLTRNRHGAGFWDRGLGEAGERLTASAHTFGELSVWFDADSEELITE